MAKIKDIVVKPVLWKKFYNILMLFCVILVLYDFSSRHCQGIHMGKLSDLVIAIILGVLLVTPEMAKALKVGARR